MRHSATLVVKWVSDRRSNAYRFAIGVGIGGLFLLTDSHSVARSMVNWVFSIFLGAAGTLLFGSFVIVALTLKKVNQRSLSTSPRHAALRRSRLRGTLDKLTYWVVKRAMSTASFIAGIAFIAFLCTGFLVGSRFVVAAMWFFALGIFLESLALPARKVGRHAPGIALGYIVGITFSPQITHVFMGVLR